MSGSSPNHGEETTVRPGGWRHAFGLKWLGMLPFLVFVATLVVLGPVLRNVPNLALLSSILSTVFILGSSLMIATLAAMTFLRTGRLIFLCFGAGAFVLAFAGAAVWLPVNEAKVAVIVGAQFLAALAAALSTAFAQRGGVTENRSRRQAGLVAAYGGGFLLLALVYTLALNRLTPPLFDPRTGFTLLKQVTSFTIAALFAAAGAFFLGWSLKTRGAFLYWYALGLLLAAMASVVNGFNTAIGAVYAWVAQSALYVSGFYWLIAVTIAVKEASARHTPVAEIIAAFLNRPGRVTSVLLTPPMLPSAPAGAV